MSSQLNQWSYPVRVQTMKNVLPSYLKLADFRQSQRAAVQQQQHVQGGKAELLGTQKENSYSSTQLRRAESCKRAFEKCSPQTKVTFCSQFVQFYGPG